MLGSIFLAAKLLRRYAPVAGAGASGIPMQVLRRLPLGPKQAIALVQIDQRVLAVSVGDGGVRLLTEFDADAPTAAAVLPPARAAALASNDVQLRASWQETLSRAVSQTLRNTGLALLVALSLAAPRSLNAQAAPRAATPAQAVAAQGGASAARLDSLIRASPRRCRCRSGSRTTAASASRAPWASS